MNIVYRLFLVFLFTAVSGSGIADTNYSISDKSHPWFPLTRAKWTMDSIQYPNGVRQQILKSGLDAKKVKVTITRKQIGFHLGCNGHGAALELTSNKKLQSSSMFSTLIMCKKQLDNSDEEVRDLLSKLSTFNTNDSNTHPTLALILDNGTRLYFHGEPIAEIKYGKPKIMRIEFKQRKENSCPKQGCQEWREVFVDSKGAIIKKSKWQYNPPKFLNFTPRPNTWSNIIIEEFKHQNTLIWRLKYSGSTSNLDYAEGNLK